MRCRTAERWISEYVDGSLDGRKKARLERHLSGCADCRAVLEDFRALVETGPALEGPEPGEAVWSRIRARLESREGGLADARVPALRLRAFGWGAPALKFAAAAALALVLVAAGVFYGIRIGRSGVRERIADPEKYTLAKLDEAERYYQQAIMSLSEAFAAQKGQMIPQVADVFERNLAVVDATIQACRQAVLKEPDDMQARNSLLAAYMDKVTVLDTALDLRTGSQAPRRQGASL
jgi:anti-sigma factor RsiW